MAWWSTGTEEPNRQFRFTVTFTIPGDGAAKRKDLTFYAMKVDKPMFKVGEYSHKFINHQFNFPGRLTWDPLTITMVDIQSKGTAAPVQSEIFRKYVLQSGYDAWSLDGDNAKTGKDGISKAAAIGALGTIQIQQLEALDSRVAATGATHKPGDSWKLSNAFLTDVKFGSLDYGSEDAVQITMTVRFDDAEIV